MPQADSVTVRLAAARAAAVAAELQRLRSQLSGATARDGWTGAARLAFDQELSDRIAQFDPAIARYDAYAASLIGYARSLEQTLPALRAARTKLVNAAATAPKVLPAPAGLTNFGLPPPSSSRVDGTSSTPDLNLEFEQLWQDWDNARRSCVSALERAGHNGADRHGLSALWHSATHAAHQAISHVNLAEISKALSELGDVLFVAALILGPIPGVGEVLWAAVAIVAVAKLAVDGMRSANGDKSVSKGDLAWDAVATLPGGKMSKAAREAAGLERTVKVASKVEGLTADATKVDIVPGGGLMAHEGPKAFGGHTILKHVGKSYEYLVSRFKNPKIFRSSSFADRATAEHLVSGALHHAREDIRNWQNTKVPVLILHATSDKEVGVTVSRFGMREMKQTHNFRIVLEKNPEMPDGYHIPTSQPSAP